MPRFPLLSALHTLESKHLINVTGKAKVVLADALLLAVFECVQSHYLHCSLYFVLFSISHTHTHTHSSSSLLTSLSLPLFCTIWELKIQCCLVCSTSTSFLLFSTLSILSLISFDPFQNTTITSTHLECQYFLFIFYSFFTSCSCFLFFCVFLYINFEPSLQVGISSSSSSCLLLSFHNNTSKPF